MLSASWAELGELDDSALDGPGRWAQEWDLASNGTAGETGPGGMHNLVGPGEIGAEYRTMKEALQTSPSPGCTPQRDPYHGRTTDPKCAARLLFFHVQGHHGVVPVFLGDPPSLGPAF